MKRLSIIIVTYNSEHDIFDCVESIKQYCGIPRNELELIIVDNNSRAPQPMFAQLKSVWGDDIVLIENDKNCGYGQGNNVGIRQAKAPVILIMNPDVRLMEPIFEKALQDFEIDNRLSIYGMKQMLSPSEPSTNSIACTNMMNGYLATILTAIANRTDRYFARFMYFSGSCFFIRKQMFEEIGLFDEDIFMYGEEDDIHHRMLKRHDCHMTYNPRLHYIHLTKDREPDLEYEKRIFQSILVLLQKKGQKKETVIKNRIRNVNLQLWREIIRVNVGKGNPLLLYMLKDFKKYLQSL